MKFIKSASKVFLVFLTLLSCDKGETINEEIKVNTIEVRAESTTLLKGETTQLNINVIPANATNKEIVWSSSDEAIAKVSTTGLVTGLSMGNVVITAKSISNPSITQTVSLEVLGENTNQITSIAVEGKEAILISENTFGVQVPNGTDLTSLKPAIVHNGHTISPSIDDENDFSQPVTYTVTSETGDSKNWTLKVIAVEDQPISPGFITKWITTNPGISDDHTIEIPTYPVDFSYYNYNVDWGDGIEEENISGDAIHSYEIPGTYYVSITGEFPRIYFNDLFYETNTDRQKIVSVNQWGNIQWQNFSQAFKGCTELDVLALDTPDFSNVRSADYMFGFCKKLEGNSSFDNWDVSTIESAAFMFSGCDVFNQDIGSWDVSNMRRMFGFFTNALTFNQDIGDWDLTNAEIIIHMFDGADSFNQDIGNWSFPKVTDLSSMFQGADSFNQDISNWDVSKIEDFSAMFNLAISFNQPIGKWDMSGAKDTSGMFQGASSFTSDITMWDVSNLESIAAMFAYNSTFNQDISGWDVSNVTNMDGVFWNNAVFNQDLSNWNTSNVTQMNGMFENATSFDRSLGNWDVSKVEDMETIFEGSGLSTQNYDATLIAWNNLPSLQNGVQFDGGYSQYCSSEVARQNLIDTYGWNITDGGKDCN
ncbi:BspA family leucine-rich repeat surface protein [Flagellimonas sp.]|uniref:BspA family leucine-rich repeat surface protein n=1 Tax=Flagellimonas sp. TaxID=2058762 RepID=UPI003BAAD6FA